MKKTDYYFLLGSDKFLLQDEPLEEIFRERVNHYVVTKKHIDFWILNAPQFFEVLLTNNESLKKIDTQSKFNNLFIPTTEELTKLQNENCFAIVSTNENFILWLKLRLNNVWAGKFIAPSPTITSPLMYKK